MNLKEGNRYDLHELKSKAWLPVMNEAMEGD